MSNRIFVEMRDQIAAGDVAIALDSIVNLVTGSKENLSQVDVGTAILQAGQFRRLERERLRGSVSSSVYARQLADLSSRVLDNLNILEDRLRRGPLPASVPLPIIVDEAPDRGLEALIGGYLRNLCWIELGLERAKAVCKVRTPNAVGTGFIAESGCLVTNNHLLPDEDTARKSIAIFNFQENLGGTIQPTYTYDLCPDYFVTNAALDCSVVSIKEAIDKPQLKSWGTLRLVRSAQIDVGDPVTIIQHPQGGPKQIAILNNQVRKVVLPRLHYTTDTMKGSSGSPVMNAHWEVVALHQGGGHWSAEHQCFLDNQGIMFSSIIQNSKLAKLLLEPA